jgi:hypothetical protein
MHRLGSSVVKAEVSINDFGRFHTDILAQILNKYSYFILSKTAIFHNFIRDLLNAAMHCDICKAQILNLKL